MKNTKTIFGLSLFTSVISAIAPMMCCWGPALLVGIAGVSGGATYFSWVHPLRPYFFGIALLSLGFAFYQAYKPVKIATGGCPNCKKKSRGFFKSKLNAWIIGIFVVSMLLFNYFPV